MSDYLRGAIRGSRSSSEFVAVLEKTVTCMDRMLGYRGEDRFVVFYHESRAQEVLWRDSHSYGFATGAWSTFMDDVAPVADHYHVNVGCHATPATHVLLIDRQDRKAYFAARSEAMQFLALVARDGSVADGLSLHKVPAAMVEITHIEITKLAHQIWESRGKPVGQDLQVWLEAEAQIKATIKSAVH